MKFRKTKIIVVGGGGHAKVVTSLIKRISSFKYIGYVDIKKNPNLNKYLGDDQFIIDNSKKGTCIAIGIGYINGIGNDNRFQIIQKYLDSNKFKFPNISEINYFEKKGIKLGIGNFINEDVTIGADTTIGDFCIINTKANIEHDCIIGNNVQIAPATNILGNVKIGNNVFIGAGTTVFNNIEISDNAKIGAGSLITKSITENGLYYGRPAKKIKEC